MAIPLSAFGGGKVAQWTAQTDSGVPYTVLTRSGSAEWPARTATEVYLIPVRRLQEFLDESFPEPRIINGWPVYEPRIMPTSAASRHYLTRRITWKDFDPTVPIDPFRGDAATAGHGALLEVTIEYSDELKEQDRDDPTTYTRLDIRTGGGIIHADMPGGKWGDAPNQVDVQEGNLNLPVIAPETEINMEFLSPMSRNFIVDSELPELYAALGRANGAGLLFPVRSPIGTVLVVGFELTELGRATGDYFELSVKLVQKLIPQVVGGSVTISSSLGHNHFWRPGVGWTRLTLPDGSNPYTLYRIERIWGVFPGGTTAPVL